MPDLEKTVTDLDQHVDLNLDDLGAERESYPPFRIRVGGATFALDAPDAGLVMEIEEARTTRAFLALAFDQQWPDVEPLLARQAPDVLLKLVREYGQHFELDQQAMIQQAAPSRAERRRRRPTRR